MRRLAFLLILLLLIPSISQARPRGIYRTVASGSVTAANMRLSGVDGGETASGGAFVDFGYKYQSDFSAGVDGWIDGGGAGVTVAGNIDGIGGEDNVLRTTVSAVAGAHSVYKPSGFRRGVKTNVTFKLYIPSTNSVVNSIVLRADYWGTSQTLTPTPDTWITYTINCTPAHGSLLLAAANGSNFTNITDAGGDDVFYIKDVKIEENPPTSYLGHLLKITDSAGKSIMGYIKAAGTGETLGDELITEWTNHPTYPVETFAVTGANITQFVNSAGGWGIVFVNKGVDLRLALYKYSTDATINSGRFDIWGIGFGSDAAAQRTVYTKPTSTGTYSGYITPNYTSALTWINIMAGPTSELDAAFINNTLKQVLTPSATGVTIVSSKGGATYNWFNKDSAFNWNDASGYKYEIIQENKPVLLDTDACTNANATINLTDGSAAWSCTGIDDSAYQDGKHICHVSDSAGRVVFGFYKASGSGAIVNAKSGSTQNWLYKNASFATDGNYTRKIFYIGD